MKRHQIICFYFTHFGNCNFGKDCSYQHEPANIPVIIEVKENMEEVAEIQQIMSKNKVKEDLLVSTNQSLDILNKELIGLKGDIDRLEKENSYKDGEIIKLKYKVSTIENESKKSLKILKNL